VKGRWSLCTDGSKEVVRHALREKKYKIIIIIEIIITIIIKPQTIMSVYQQLITQNTPLSIP
jgi:hypothetical protein